MKNYEQIRAKNALEAADNPGYRFTGQKEGEVVKKVPAMIRENGFLAAAAFAKEKGGGYEDVFKATIKHLTDPEIGKLKGEMSLKDLISFLSGKATSAGLREITAEALAYLNYLRRFARTNKKPGRNKDERNGN